MQNSTNDRISTDDFGADAQALLQTGEHFMQVICNLLRERTGAAVAFAGSLGIAEAEEVRVLGLSTAGSSIEVDHYNCLLSPCREVFKSKRPVLFLENLGKSFPDCPAIAAFNSQAYIGFPLINGSNDVIGHIAFEWLRPVSSKEAADVIDVVQGFLPRIESEAIQLARGHALQAMLEPEHKMTGLNDQESFNLIVKQACEIAQVYGAFLAKTVDRKGSEFKVLAAYAGGHYLEEFVGTVLPYRGSPCENLISGPSYCEPKGLHENYKKLEILSAHKIAAYCGFGFHDDSSVPIGHLAFWHQNPMSSRMLKCKIINIIVSRAERELKRFVINEDRKRLRASLQVQNKLESLGLMAGTIAHDFNNQLASSIGNTELALLSLTDNHPAKMYVKEVEAGLWRARDVVAEILEFAGNAPKSAVSQIDLNASISACMSELKSSCPQNIECAISLSPDLPKIEARESQLHQILKNLVVNAIEAIGSNVARISVSTRLIHPSEYDCALCLTGYTSELAGYCVSLEVSDTGPGLEPEKAERIFEPFFSIKGVSRGLGLASVLGIAKANKAGLMFETAPNKGTSFKLLFSPASTLDQKLTTIGSRVESDSESKKKKVLVVDDDISVLDTIANQVNALGYDAIKATSGSAAINVVNNKQDLFCAVIDIVMPELDGWKTLRAIRQVTPGCPAIMMSGFDGESVQNLDGNTLKLLKPFRISRLKDALSSLELWEKASVG